MTQSELIALARSGQRITKAQAEHSLHESVSNLGPHTCRVRAIVCNGDHDVVECVACGRQMVVRCNFDEEYS